MPTVLSRKSFLNTLAMFLPTHPTDQTGKCMTYQLRSNTNQLELSYGSDAIRHC